MKSSEMVVAHKSIPVENAVELYLNYLKDNTRPNTVRSFRYPLEKFKAHFHGLDMSAINESNIIEFISSISASNKASTKSSRIRHPFHCYFS